MRTLHIAATTLAAAVCLLAVGGAPATADPQKGLLIPTTCSDGNTYTVVQQAGQNWNAQLDTDSNSAFHLTWFEISFRVTEADGTVNVFGPFEAVKGGNDRSHKDLLSCTFSFFLDLGDGRTAINFGSVQGWLTPSGG